MSKSRDDGASSCLSLDGEETGSLQVFGVGREVSGVDLARVATGSGNVPARHVAHG